MGKGTRVGQRLPMNGCGYNAERDYADNGGYNRQQPDLWPKPFVAVEPMVGIPSLPAVSLRNRSRDSGRTQGDCRTQPDYQGPAELQRFLEQSH